MSPAGEALLPATPVAGEALPWRRGLAWLLFLGPFFFLSYGFANWWAATQASPGTIVFDWERRLPFLAWTIVPYWSIDLLYGLSFLLCHSRRRVDTHALRLLSAQLICVACFLAFPLGFSFQRPAADGLFGALFGALFDALAGFDRPFNQAPSLHIALLVVLWARYAEASRGPWRLLTHGWALLIGLSVLTTYQHHFIDVPTGALVGLLCLWLWPDDGRPILAGWQSSPSPARRRLGLRYCLAALACLVPAGLGGWALWLLWPAFSLGLVGLIYLGLGTAGFGKRDGRQSVAAAWLLAPYRLGAWINSRLWTRRHPAPAEIADGVWLGRLPGRREALAGGWAGLVDLTAEFSAPRGPWRVAGLPWLDLVPPAREDLEAAAECIEKLRQAAGGRVLVCCALGYSRSAAAVAAWLLRTGRAASVDEALARIAARRPNIVLGREHRAALQALLPEGRPRHA